MKRSEVGNFRVLLGPEGGALIDHTRTGKENTFNQRIQIPPNELADLIVALDGVLNEQRLPEETLDYVVHSAFQRALHEIYKTAMFRCRLELHVELDDLWRLCPDENRWTRPRHDRYEADLGAIRLVHIRGKGARL